MSWNRGLFISSASGDYETPQGIFDALNEEFHFVLDACATAETAKCPNFISPEQDALAVEWVRLAKLWSNPAGGCLCQCHHPELQSIADESSQLRVSSSRLIRGSGTASPHAVEIATESGLDCGSSDEGLKLKSGRGYSSRKGGTQPQKRGVPTSDVLAPSITTGGDSAPTFPSSGAPNCGNDASEPGAIVVPIATSRPTVSGKTISLLTATQGAQEPFPGTCSRPAPPAISPSSRSGPRSGLGTSGVFPRSCLTCSECKPYTGAIFSNPPYGRHVGDWVRKGYEEAAKGALVVMLLPARTDTRWFHDYVMKAQEIRFIRGRLKFGGAKTGAPFPSAVVVFRPPVVRSVGAEGGE